ncbi:MAG: 50S ribosomal protein L1 [Dehalococcoidia bacterium]|nr:50S ribosomal protein L1 [Chloroflexota bacterium]MBT9159100.1 50S ribosomal protein L1 [Chloroflexota bacterium]MBT9161499.1 50S ribosomal protein L1 [Chloroflexota bacterium]
MTKHGKKYQEAAKLVDQDRLYSPQEAVELAKKASFTKFDETVELHFRLGVDPRHADQQVRGVATLPNGLGKQVMVLVFTQGEGERIARGAGADYVGADELIKQIEGGWLGFDVAIATPDIMPKIGKLGKILGRRGLMPNPKSGTIANPDDLPRVISEVRQGRVEFKLDKTALIHLPIGKVSFPADKLLQNLSSVVEAILSAKPSGSKGEFIRSISLATSMGPGIRLDLKTTLSLSAG